MPTRSVGRKWLFVDFITRNWKRTSKTGPKWPIMIVIISLMILIPSIKTINTGGHECVVRWRERCRISVDNGVLSDDRDSIKNGGVFDDQTHFEECFEKCINNDHA